MRTWRLSLLAVLLAATAACHDSKGAKEAKPPKPPAPPTTELVSLAWKPANANQNLQSFELKLTGAEIVSVCKKPPGWVVDASGATIKGYATVGAGFVSVEHLDDLEGLFLIRTHGQPPGLSGKLLTGVYADDGEQSEVAATPNLLSREPAAQCPPPRG
ncbi:hypothetical protein [Caulobacter sp.]|uniref:hypothetical protein n=1 Tax=Caulobacter sp. TaxID=78 RepID=UPI001B1BBFE1|nr:hypothetical protein [Caulobacter sp.]MBO9544674.1 hypothetical protein [Caulobacter sp.]